MDFEIINDKESNLKTKGYCWKASAAYGWDKDYWSYQKSVHNENVDDAFDSFAEGHDPVCKGEDGKLYSVMFRVSEHEDGSYWYRPVIWQEVEPKSKKTFERVTWNTEWEIIKFVSSRDIGMNGKHFRIWSGYPDRFWNGEKWSDCDLVSPDDFTEVIKDGFSLKPVYDWENFDEELDEFLGSDGGDPIDYDVTED